MKQMSHDSKRVVLAHMNVKLFRWTFTTHNVVRKQIWGDVLILIQTSSTDPFWPEQWKKI